MKTSTSMSVSAVAATLIALGAGCLPALQPSGGRRQESVGGADQIGSGRVHFLLSDGLPSDVVAIRVRSCPEVEKTCGGEVREWRIAPDGGETRMTADGVLAGATMFKLDALGASDRVLGEASFSWTVIPGEQTVPPVELRLTNRRYVELPVAVPVAPDGDAAVSWRRDIQPLFAANDGCTMCHTGEDSPMDNHVRLDLSRYPFTSGTKPDWSFREFVEEAIARLELPQGASGQMPMGGVWDAQRISLVSRWLEGGLLEDAPAGRLPPAPPHLATIELELSELWGSAVVKTWPAIPLARGAQRFEGRVPDVAVGCTYRMTLRLYDASHRLLREAVDVVDRIAGDERMDVLVDFTDLDGPAAGQVTIPIVVPRP